MSVKPFVPEPRFLARLFFSFARAARTGFLWFLSPAESLLDRAFRRSTRPPLWLRRHAGPLRHFHQSACDMMLFLKSLDVFQPRVRIVDVGCGPGGMALELRNMLSPTAQYLGFDPHRESIEWCKDHFRGDRRFRFLIASIASQYGGRRHSTPAAEYRFPVESAEADLVLAKSVFTHLLPEAVPHYLEEVRRILAKDGVAVLTAFLFEPPDGGSIAFPFSTSDGQVRWRRSGRPVAGIAYDRALFEEWIRALDLKIRWMSTGFWPGLDSDLRGQDTLVIGK